MKNKNRLFWILQCSGWLFYWVVNMILLLVRGNLTNYQLVRYSAATLAGFTATLLLRVLYKGIKLQSRSVLQIALIGTPASFVASNILIWISNLLRFPFWGMKAFTTNPTLLSYLQRLSWWVIPTLGWSALYFGIKFWYEWNLQRERTEEAQALAQRAQLQMLRYQLNPHFLFNSLNSIRALIREDKLKAKRMITELSEFLRYSLISKNYKDIPLKEEVEAIRHFFNIQKMRYENKLEVSYDVDPAVEDSPVLSFIIHPLAENAIKHGMSTSSIPLHIDIKALRQNGNLCIEVKNSGKWIAPSKQVTDSVVLTGLDNVRQRLADAYPERHSFDVFEKEGYVHARLEIFMHSGK